MRLFLAVMTVGIVGAGYLYFLQTNAQQPEEPVAALRPLFDWEAADEISGTTPDVGTPPSADAPLVVRDTDHPARSEAPSALDEFIRTDTGLTNSQPQSSPVEIVSDQAGATSDRSDPSPGIIENQDVAVPTTESMPRTDIPPEEIHQTEEIQAADATAAGNVSQTGVQPATMDHVTTTEPNKQSTVPRPSISEAALITQQPLAGENRKTTIIEVADKQAPQANSLTGRSALETTARTSAAPFDSQWKVRAKTTGGVPMHTRHFGDQGARTLVVAGIDGQDSIAVRWIDDLAGSLPRHSELFPSNEVLIFRAGNPDGLIRKTSANARGVLINRNFPSRRYRPFPDRSAGPRPASEAETQAILDSLYAFRPRRVIHLMATRGPSRILYNRAARDVADELRREYKIDVLPLDTEQSPGSIEDFADGTFDAGVLSVRLSIGTDWKLSWPKHLPLVLTAINGRSVNKSDELVESSPDADRTPIPVSVAKPPEIQKNHRGYEELPPPPR